MARLQSEIEVTCPCCQATLVIDTNLGRIVSHQEPERGNKPELSDAQRILAEEARRRDAMFQQSFDAEKTRGDALSSRSPSRCATSISTETISRRRRGGGGATGSHATIAPRDRSQRRESPGVR
jgi:hypothetical protein